ncbi:RNA-guided endonuclease InsQ/TnpB family protein [Acidithiobacillus sulfurivorans]|uniref:IS200/IS605 family element transposase accessory protein TnpB n=1 Tax=Acidithiobacillus sulfurivorans TaxID=1958756 RepID=A0ABS6A503_9PROT|nr:RNA-guided endonuclease TnpB family protein [Acidithiobacillus sulfurivorans]MBU2761794.1 IS200/IS605 family element transposase accessory protein TnpB [Acidithiobacillus sulfurivorans]
MLIAHKIRLDPNNVQATYFARASGTARFAYNWALAEWQHQYEAWKQDNRQPKPSQMALRRQLNALKREQFPWMLEVTKNAPQMAIIQLGDAFKYFWAGRANYPKFRKKGVHDRFSLSNDQFSVKGSRIRIPNLGWVRMRESLRFTGKIMSATVSHVADKWFVSITVDTEESPTRSAENQGVVGVDLGVLALATLSTGEKIVGPKPHKALLKRQKRLSHSLSRKHKAAKVKLGLGANAPIPKGVRLPVSENAKKARAKLSRLHARIANIRQDALHKLTSDLTRRFHTIGIENLNVRGMLKNRRLARSIADMSFFEFRRQLEYKAGRRGGIVVVADRWFPSSKTCSVCGTIQEKMPLAVRQWTCPDCGAIHDRDVNAARNLLALGLATLSGSTASSVVCEACGEEGTGSGRKTGVKPASMKQESSSKAIYG